MRECSRRHHPRDMAEREPGFKENPTPKASRPPAQRCAAAASPWNRRRESPQPRRGCGLRRCEPNVAPSAQTRVRVEPHRVLSTPSADSVTHPPGGRRVARFGVLRHSRAGRNRPWRMGHARPFRAAAIPCRGPSVCQNSTRSGRPASGRLSCMMRTASFSTQCRSRIAKSAPQGAGQRSAPKGRNNQSQGRQLFAQ